MKHTDSGADHAAPSVQLVFRRSGIKGYLMEVSGTLVVLVLGLASLGEAPLIWIPVVATLAVLWCIWWLSHQQRIYLVEDRLIYLPHPWMRFGSHGAGWEVPLAEARIEVRTVPAGMPWFRPWMMTATVKCQHQSHLIKRVLEWTRTRVPSDALNQAKLAERVRYAKRNLLDEAIEFPLLRELAARGVPVLSVDE